MAKGYAPNMLDYRNQASDLLKGQMDIQKSKMDIMSREPTGYEAEQELLANTRNVVGSGARGKRGSELVIDGVLNGLQYGMRSKEVAGKKDQYSKMRNVLGYFEQVGQELQKQNQQNMQDEEERLQMEPTALTAIDLTYSGMPYEQTDAALRKLFETAKVNNSFVTEDYVGYIPNSSLILMRDENGEVFPADMRSMLRREDVESVQNNYNQRIGNDARMMGARASMMNAETNAAYAPINAEAKQSYMKNTDFNTDPQQRAERAALEERARQNAKYMVELEPKLQNADRALSDLQDLKKVLSDSWTSGSSATKSLLRWLQQRTGSTYTADKISMAMSSQLPSLKEIFGGNPSDADRELFMQTLPGIDKNPKASIERLNQLITQYENKANLYRGQARKYNEQPWANLFTDTGNITQQGSVPYEQGTQTMQVKVRDPNNPNRIKLFSPEEAEIAIKRGGIRVQ